MKALAGDILRPLAIPTIGISILGLFGILYVNDPHVYQRVMSAIMKVETSNYRVCIERSGHLGGLLIG